MNNRSQRIRNALQVLQPVTLEIHDDSHKHAGHNPAAANGGETHFRLVIVSAQFSNKSRVQRHRMVQDLLKAEFDSGLHALQIKAEAP